MTFRLETYHRLTTLMSDFGDGKFNNYSRIEKRIIAPTPVTISSSSASGPKKHLGRSETRAFVIVQWRSMTPLHRCILAPTSQKNSSVQYHTRNMVIVCLPIIIFVTCLSVSPHVICIHRRRHASSMNQRPATADGVFIINTGNNIRNVATGLSS